MSAVRPSNGCIARNRAEAAVTAGSNRVSFFVRIAISGAHVVGKSTLITDLHDARPEFQVVEEPYHELSDEGHLFSEYPSTDDFVVQLERSIRLLSSARSENMIFERCPADFLAYLAALDALDVVSEWLPAAKDAMRALDLVVFLPVEHPDRIATTEAALLRRRADAALREILLEDSHGLGVRAVCIQGSRQARLDRIIAVLREQ